jgi:hypothetical protein
MATRAQCQVIDFCPHARVRKGYYLGFADVEYVCVVCGKSARGPHCPAQALEYENRDAHGSIQPRPALYSD